MSVSKFKAQCLTLLNNLDPEGLEITRYGKVVARVIPVEQQSASLIGYVKGKIKKKDNLFRTGVQWYAKS